MEQFYISLIITTVCVCIGVLLGAYTFLGVATLYDYISDSIRRKKRAKRGDSKQFCKCDGIYLPKP